MKNIYLPLCAVTLLLASCSSGYKTTQSSDDSYYSTGARQSTSSSSSDVYYNANADDQYLMMKSQDPQKWAYFDDYAYDGYSPYASPYGMSPYGMSPYYSLGYSPFGFGYYPMGFYSGFGVSPFMYYGYSYWGPNYLSEYYLWNGMYNPYYGGVVVVSPYPAYNYYTQVHPFVLNNYTATALSNRGAFRNSYNNGLVRAKPFTNNAYNRSINTVNSPYSSGSFFNRGQGTQSVRSFSPSSFGGGGGGFRSFGRSGR